MSWDAEVVFCPGCREALSSHFPDSDLYACRVCGRAYSISRGELGAPEGASAEPGGAAPDHATPWEIARLVPDSLPVTQDLVATAVTQLIADLTAPPAAGEREARAETDSDLVREAQLVLHLLLMHRQSGTPLPDERRHAVITNRLADWLDVTPEGDVERVVRAAVAIVSRDRVEYARMVQMPTALSGPAQKALRELFAAVDEYERTRSTPAASPPAGGATAADSMDDTANPERSAHMARVDEPARKKLEAWVFLRSGAEATNFGEVRFRLEGDTPMDDPIFPAGWVRAEWLDSPRRLTWPITTTPAPAPPVEGAPEGPLRAPAPPWEDAAREGA